jgi:hypothetical protein
MPNWVYNSMTVNGNLPDLQHFQQTINKPSIRKVEGGYESEPNGPTQFSYWGIKSPDDLDAYFGTDETSASHWYIWNVANWGCKWDACESSVMLIRQNNHSLLYLTWESPWSAPIEWVTHCAKEYPELEFSFHYEEEQGWGGNMDFYKGELTHSDEYDTPSSHAEYTEREKDCVCTWEGYAFFSDCPEAETSEEGATP